MGLPIQRRGRSDGLSLRTLPEQIAAFDHHSAPDGFPGITRARTASGFNAGKYLGTLGLEPGNLLGGLLGDLQFYGGCLPTFTGRWDALFARIFKGALLTLASLL